MKPSHIEESRGSIKLATNTVGNQLIDRYVKGNAMATYGHDYLYPVEQPAMCGCNGLCKRAIGHEVSGDCALDRELNLINIGRVQRLNDNELAIGRAARTITDNWEKWECEAGDISQREQNPDAGDAVLIAYLTMVITQAVKSQK